MEVQNRKLGKQYVGKLKAALVGMVITVLEKAIVAFVSERRGEMPEDEVAIKVLRVPMDSSWLPKLDDMEERAFKYFSGINEHLFVVTMFDRRFLFWTVMPTREDALALKKILYLSPCSFINGHGCCKSQYLQDWTHGFRALAS